MIPIRLWVRNFLSYGEDVEPLDFTSFQLACLSGRNGHGKSALLDAMTWALWGEARKAGYSRNPDPDLLRQNAEDMAVEFTFVLDNREYQVFREFSLHRRSSKLEFRGRNLTDDEYRLLTGNSKKDTQKRIIETLGLDYRTFTNSSFLQQGKADEFTRQSPKERKEILCTILGLDYYERLLEETKQRWSLTRAEKKAAEARLEHLDKQLAEEESIQKQEHELSESHRKNEEALKLAQTEERELNNQISNLTLVRDRVNRWSEEKSELQKQEQDTHKRHQRLEIEYNSMNELLQRKEAIHKNYERYEELTKELQQLINVESDYREKDTQRQAMERRIERKRGELREQLAGLESERKQNEQSLAECQSWLERKESIELHYKEFQELESKLKHLETLRPEYERLKRSMEDFERDIERERQSISEQVAEIRGRMERLQSLRKSIAEAPKIATRLANVEQEYNALHAAVKRLIEQGQENNLRIEQLQKEVEDCKKTQEELLEKSHLMNRNESAECPLCKQGLTHSSREEIIKHFEEETVETQKKQASKEQEIERRTLQRKELQTQYRIKNKELEEKEKEFTHIRHKQEELKSSHEEIKQLEPKEAELKVLIQRLKEEQFAPEARSNWKKCQQAIQEVPYDPEQETQLQKRLQVHRQHERDWLQLQEALKRKSQWETRLQEIEKQRETIGNDLQNDNFAKEERESLRSLQQELAPLVEKLSERKKLQDEHYALRNAPVEWNRLQHAIEEAPRMKTDLQSLHEQKLQIQKRLQEIEEELKQSTPQLATLEATGKRLTQKEQERNGLEKTRDEIQMQLGAVREKKAQLALRKQERSETQQQLKTLHQEEHQYEILKTAFSRDGIPALIVEEALPELELYANQLLQRLTNGTFSVALESQRKKQSGGMSETLDIQISDDIGTRNYELFSGGEAFRTDLALRIALSQLLCHRAGRKLQLLVIDEGFGTQDSEGLNNIVEAINDIQDEFEKIIVVTHLEELKEKFLARIEVNKEPGMGSRFEVVHT